MIIYGWRSTVETGKSLQSTPCTSCGKTGLAAFREFSYVHIYWIPLLPTGSKQHTVCGHCNAQTSGGHISSEVKSQIKLQNADASRPLWHYAGAMIVALLVAYGAVQNALQPEEAQAAKADAVEERYGH